MDAIGSPIKMLRKSELKVLADDLMNAPAPDVPLTKKDAMQQLVPVLKKMKDAGHNNESIAHALAARGVAANPRDVARALAVPRRSSKGRTGVSN